MGVLIGVLMSVLIGVLMGVLMGVLIGVLLGVFTDTFVDRVIPLIRIFLVFAVGGLHRNVVRNMTTLSYSWGSSRPILAATNYLKTTCYWLASNRRLSPIARHVVTYCTALDDQQ